MAGGDDAFNTFFSETGAGKHVRRGKEKKQKKNNNLLMIRWGIYNFLKTGYQFSTRFLL